MNRALFLDRDGVINVDRGFVWRRQDFEFVDGIFDLVRMAVAHEMLPIVVTNQSGIGRGYYDEPAFEDLMGFVRYRFEQELAPLTAVYFSPFHPEARVERYRADHPSRKPKPGMFLDAIADHGIDPARSAMVGDGWRDALAASAAGVSAIALLGDPGPAPAGAPKVNRFQDLNETLAWFERWVHA
ncbi:D-glycero-alpha-D-manno-heptose-1,7-bisphosphate 7-phosphatase [Mycolicibacterium sp. ELW1]|uniref:D-glycero-alpha-D-manno-heptose-1,7-bisphosphate 7-phosphatase n=1 Tax=Mycobacteriaceae TaxID=1762 RepID=UPI0011EFAC91|nr:HAD family hydrolase [Mycobacterium sp. ELW1]QEN12692.1 HAD family hydrolase [Mycobacterium sp. ELW1]